MVLVANSRRARFPALASADLPARVGTWMLSFALVSYLALHGGGYDVVLRSQVGIAIWWFLLVGAAVGLLPARRLAGLSAMGLALLGAFALWTALSAVWSQSAERSVLEASRASMYLGVFVIGLATTVPQRGRTMLNGVAAALSLVAAIAVLSRLKPDWFPQDATAEFLPATKSRLSYPLNYWNALAALMAIGLPLVFTLAAWGRSVAGRSVAAGVIPMIVLCGYLTLSRGGVVAAAAALVVLIALAPDRWKLLICGVVGGVGGAVLVVALEHRDALAANDGSSLARQQGAEMLLAIIVVCGVVACLCAAMTLAARSRSRRFELRLHGRFVPAAVVSLIVAGGAAAVALGAPAAARDKWEHFKNPTVASADAAHATAARFSSASGNGRYQYWVVGVDAFRAEPLHGVGAGSFEYWWTRHATIPGFIRNAHSLYVETLAELGSIGMLMLLGFFSSLLAGVGVALRRGVDRRLIAPTAAAIAAFAVSASVDWVWQVPVIPTAVLLVTAVLLGAATRTESTRGRGVARVVIAVLALPCLLVLVVPMATTLAVRDSQAAAAKGDLRSAFKSAADAASIEPYAATPELQRGLVLEAAGEFSAAVRAVGIAARHEPTNWRLRLVLARIEAERGDVRASLAAYRRAHMLNPKSTVFR